MLYPITSKFRSMESFRTKPHSGLDFSMESGTPLRSLLDGKIERIVDFGNQNLGKGVFVKFSDGKTAIYGHLSSFGNIKVGEEIRAGEIIGYSGNTGFSTGPHLHFSIKENSEFLDPSPYVDLIQNMNTPNFLALNQIKLSSKEVMYNEHFAQTIENTTDFLSSFRDNHLEILEYISSNLHFVSTIIKKFLI